MLKFKVGDTVKISLGKDKGQTGKVEKIFPKTNSLLVKGKNLYKKHLKSQGKEKPGGIVDIARPLSFAKIVLLCPKCNQPTRVAFKIVKGKTSGKKTEKYRVCKKCKQIIS